jgi:hypothetical protein
MREGESFHYWLQIATFVLEKDWNEIKIKLNMKN